MCVNYLHVTWNDNVLCNLTLNVSIMLMDGFHIIVVNTFGYYLYSMKVYVDSLYYSTLTNFTFRKGVCVPVPPPQLQS